MAARGGAAAAAAPGRESGMRESAAWKYKLHTFLRDDGDIKPEIIAGILGGGDNNSNY